jgi:hypothetical protein
VFLNRYVCLSFDDFISSFVYFYFVFCSPADPLYHVAKEIVNDGAAA